jgi:hypothetical protein
MSASTCATTSRAVRVVWCRAATAAATPIATAKQPTPERERVITKATAMHATATAASCTRPPSGDESHRRRWRRSGRTRRIPTCARPMAYPAASGSPISIQPAKWFLLTNGPNGVVSL